jgi:O-antigen/teichoic acid export membrane protein
VGFRFASVVNLLMVGFYGALTPLIYQHYRKDSTSKELASIFCYFFCGTLPLIAAVSLFSKEMLWLFATPPYYAAWSVMPILACASVISRMYIFAPGLDIAKKTTTIALINLSAALTNIILNFIMIPHLGIEGAAGATLISAILTFAGYMILSQRYYPVHHFWREIMSVTLISAAAVITGLIFFNHSESFETSRFVLKLILLIGTALVTVWILLKRIDSMEKT